MRWRWYREGAGGVYGQAVTSVQYAAGLLRQMAGHSRAVASYGGIMSNGLKYETMSAFKRCRL